VVHREKKENAVLMERPVQAEHPVQRQGQQVAVECLVLLVAMELPAFQGPLDLAVHWEYRGFQVQWVRLVVLAVPDRAVRQQRAVRRVQVVVPGFQALQALQAVWGLLDQAGRQVAEEVMAHRELQGQVIRLRERLELPVHPAVKAVVVRQVQAARLELQRQVRVGLLERLQLGLLQVHRDHLLPLQEPQGLLGRVERVEIQGRQEHPVQAIQHRERPVHRELVAHRLGHPEQVGQRGLMGLQVVLEYPVLLVRVAFRGGREIQEILALLEHPAVVGHPVVLEARGHPAQQVVQVHPAALDRQGQAEHQDQEAVMVPAVRPEVWDRLDQQGLLDQQVPPGHPAPGKSWSGQKRINLHQVLDGLHQQLDLLFPLRKTTSMLLDLISGFLERGRHRLLTLGHSLQEPPEQVEQTIIGCYISQWLVMERQV